MGVHKCMSRGGKYEEKFVLLLGLLGLFEEEGEEKKEEEEREEGEQGERRRRRKRRSGERLVVDVAVVSFFFSFDPGFHRARRRSRRRLDAQRLRRRAAAGAACGEGHEAGRRVRVLRR